MRFLLDTNVWVEILRGNLTVAQRFRSHGVAEICVCSVVKAELYHGARKSANVASNLASLNLLLDSVISFPFDDHAAERYGYHRQWLEKAGQMIAGNDLMIASIAVTHDLTVVTNNTREFARIPGLPLEDWSAS